MKIITLGGMKCNIYCSEKHNILYPWMLKVVYGQDSSSSVISSYFLHFIYVGRTFLAIVGRYRLLIIKEQF